jgi:hypothetical protein
MFGIRKEPLWDFNKPKKTTKASKYTKLVTHLTSTQILTSEVTTDSDLVTNLVTDTLISTASEAQVQDYSDSFSQEIFPVLQEIFNDVLLAGRLEESDTVSTVSGADLKSKVSVTSKDTAQSTISISTVDPHQIPSSNESGALETTAVNGTLEYVTPFMLDSYSRHNETHEVFKIRNSANHKIETVIGVSQVPPEPVSAVIIINIGSESESSGSGDYLTSVANNLEESLLDSTKVPFEMVTVPDYVADAAVEYHVKSIGELPSPFWDGGPRLGNRTNFESNRFSHKTAAITTHCFEL